VQIIALVLAVLGALGLAYRFLRSVARFVLAFADATAASGLAEASARRGDLTRLEEQRHQERTARRRQRRDAMVAGLWLLWLIVPPLTPWTQPLYAAAAPLWLLSDRLIRRRTAGSA
jgi:hypothetical protein